MNIKRYQNELILLSAVIFLVASFFYKQVQRAKMSEVNQQMVQEISIFQETVSLKKIWDNKRVSQKLESIKKLVPSSKIKWQKKGKKLTVKFTDMRPSDINKVVTKLLNIAVQLESMKIEKNGKYYQMEIKCKW